MPEKYFFGTRHFYLGEEWINRGHSVTVFSSSSNHLTDNLPKFRGKFLIEDFNGVQTVWLNSLKSHNPSSFKRILGWFHFEWLLFTFVFKQLKKQSNHPLFVHKKNNNTLNVPDIVIVSSLSLLSILTGWYFSRKYKCKFLLEVRDIWPLTAVQSVGYSSWHPFILVMSWIEKFGYKNADAIIGTMPNLIEHVRNVEPRFKKCITIPQGVTKAQLDNQVTLDPQYVNRLFQKPSFKIAYTGTLNVSDNPVDVLLDAAAKIGPKAGVDIFILGRGTMKETYIQKYGHLSHIHFPDVIEKKYVHSFLQNIDLCFDAIGGDIAKYGHSRNKWMDYMAAAKPILCATSGFKSIINEADCGSYVPFDDIDAMCREVIKYRDMDTKELKRLGDNARQYLIDHRTFDKLAVKYEELF
jgi:glycosyltransferase involved in cell wall biosynthesis